MALPFHTAATERNIGRRWLKEIESLPEVLKGYAGTIAHIADRSNGFPEVG